MKFFKIATLLILAGVLSSCWIEAAEDMPNGPGEPDPVPYENVTNSNLPTGSLSGNSMNALSADLDNDGDLDLVIAIEFGPNRLLINNGAGVFSDQSANKLPGFNFNSNDIAIAKFNSDNLFDIFFANAANRTTQQTNEFYLNQPGFVFLDRRDLITDPVLGISNATVARDLDNDQDIDLLIGNNGQNRILLNNGNARFINDDSRIPQRLDLTQDLEVGDLTGNGFPDIVVANENDDNRILINSGSGFYFDQTGERLPVIGGIEETREVELADIDGDGDLDIYFSNVQLFESGANPQDRLLVNNGRGVFTDVTSSQLPQKTTNTFDTDFLDIDGDGDLDILTGNFNGGVRVFLNDGTGNFTDNTENWLPENFNPRAVDFEIADYNGDQLPDIYIAVFDGSDVLLIRNNQQ